MEAYTGVITRETCPTKGKAAGDPANPAIEQAHWISRCRKDRFVDVTRENGFATYEFHFVRTRYRRISWIGPTRFPVAADGISFHRIPGNAVSTSNKDGICIGGTPGRPGCGNRRPATNRAAIQPAVLVFDRQPCCHHYRRKRRRLDFDALPDDADAAAGRRGDPGIS